MNLVVGATGMVGTEVCRLLASTGKPVRALVRGSSDAAKVAKLEALGAKVVKGDLRDEASLRAACQGVKTVLTTASSMPFAYVADDNTPHSVDQEGCLSLIDAAHEAGVQQFVYTSFPSMAAQFPLQDAKRAVEARLRQGGLRYTVLRPTYFTEVWLSPAVGFDYANRKATVYGAGENAISWISYLDVAAFAAASLDNPAARDAVLELGGPEGISPHRVIEVFEKAGGKPFEVTSVPVTALQQQLLQATDPMQKSFAGLMLSYASAKAIDMAWTLKTFPLKLRTVEEYARGVMA
jgi:NADH dehydrogenase